MNERETPGIELYQLLGADSGSRAKRCARSIQTRNCRFAEATSSLEHVTRFGTNPQAWLGNVDARAGETEKALNVSNELEERSKERYAAYNNVEAPKSKSGPYVALAGQRIHTDT